MRTQSDTQENSASAITFPVVPNAPWRVVDVRALDAYQLQVRFVDGTEGAVDMTALIHSPQAGVFGCLVDTNVFRQVGTEYGAVSWPDGPDLAPDAMYAAIKATGVWVLT